MRLAAIAILTIATACTPLKVPGGATPAAPKPAPSTAPSATTATQEPISLSGTGRTGLTRVFKLAAGRRNFTGSHTGKMNFSAVLKAADGEYITLVFNKIGAYNGTYTTIVEKSGDYVLDVEADGDWTVSIE
jgi:hypothetical protein